MEPLDPIEALLACEEDPCRLAQVEAAWRADADRVEMWLATLEDSVSQAVVTDRLTFHFREDAERICQTLVPDSPTHSRCARQNIRAHLYNSSKSSRGVRTVDPDAASGPRTTQMVAPVVGEAPWLGTDPGMLESLLGDCTIQRELCALEAATEKARAGAANEVGRLCLAGDPTAGKQYGECLFRSAEELANTHGALFLEEVFRLCAHSNYSQECISHTLSRGSPNAPPASGLTKAAFAESEAYAQAIKTATRSHPELTEIYIGRHWANWIFTAMHRSEPLEGGKLEHLPPGLAAIARVPIYWRLMRDHPPGDASFDSVVGSIEERLSLPIEVAAHPGRYPVQVKNRGERWTEDLAGEERLPALWIGGPSRRAVSDDPDVDLQIAVLEAAAKLEPPPPASFFLSVVGDESRHSWVRWTGARIGAAMDAEAAQRLSDPDPLVAARLDPNAVRHASGKGAKIRGKSP